MSRDVKLILVLVTLVASLTVVSLFITSGGSPSCNVPEQRTVDLNQAFENGKAYMFQSEELFTSGAPWALFSIAQNCGDTELEAFALSKVNEYFVQYPEKAFFTKFFDPSFTIESDEGFKDLFLTDYYLATALYCKDFRIENEFTFELLANQAGDYFTTHALMGLIILEENGCSPNLSAEKTILVNSLLEKQGNVNFCDGLAVDLFAESVAWIAEAGFADSLGDDWYEMIALRQQPDGGWVADDSETQSNIQTTSVALWALSEKVC